MDMRLHLVAGALKVRVSVVMPGIVVRVGVPRLLPPRVGRMSTMLVGMAVPMLVGMPVLVDVRVAVHQVPVPVHVSVGVLVQVGMLVRVFVLVLVPMLVRMSRPLPRVAHGVVMRMLVRQSLPA